ncbi:dihydrolipoyl dehydrogenase [Hyphomicrobium sp.]|uniref:dihydrolipoyl dehydrogenase n=1 Tax=Hyphomicrobium sp. TaxID=82 RepID=UPI002E35FCE6|nr:dihydrolipoyl dehydrogenase [Hyphomicrobium sp.]HEX2841244.1 dihydrolipoyl dehydrogenase [Hyphomicrobium sp.]
MRHIAILGGGPAGYVAASHAAAHGARVTLIDPKPLGGTCLNQGCVPTKVLVESCSLLEKAKKGDTFGLRIQGEVSADWGAINRRSADIIAMLGQGIERLMEDRNVTCIRGYGRFLDAKTIQVNDEIVRPDTVLICTGSVPMADPQFNVDGEAIGTSDDLLAWETLPKSIVIVGSGIIACEFAFILDSLGVEVTILASGSRVMSAADPDVTAVLQREMRKRNIRVQLNCRVQSLLHTANGVSAISDGRIACSAERALVAVGRKPNSAHLGLAQAGVKTNQWGEIIVDEVLKTNVEGVYAPGDVNGRSGLAHAASAQAKLAVDHALRREFSLLYDRAIPVAVFTSPEIAWVGRTEGEALADGFDAGTGKFDLRGLGRAHALGEIAGFAKVVIDKRSGELLGLHIIGPHAAEMIHEGAVVLQRNGKAADLFATVHAHPTISEGILEAVEDVLGQATHKPLAPRRKEQNVLQFT